MVDSNLVAETHDGVPVMIKPGVGVQASQRGHEAEILTAARHPGVVELLSASQNGDSFDLCLARVHGRNLLDQPPLTSTNLARVIAEVAQTLTDLHSLGIVHGNIGAEHILLDRHLHATICGFGNAKWSRHQDDGDDIDPGLDVIAIGRLLDHELSRSLDCNTVDDTEPLVIGLHHVADLADSTPVDGQHIFMSDIAYRLHRLAGGPTHRSHAQTAHPRPDVLERIRVQLEGSRHVAVGLALAVLIVTTSWLAWSAFSGGHTGVATAAVDQSRSGIDNDVVEPDAPMDTEGLSASEPAAPQPTLIRTAVAPPCPVWDETPAATADVDGDGCEEPWWRVGAVLTVGSDRYALGTAADLVAIGDWNCDGIATPALVDVATGAVYFFEHWARDGGTTTAVVTRRVVEARSVTVTRVATCDLLTIMTARGVITVNGAPT